MGSSRAVKTTELPPPDGGWGWAVMVASFFAHFMTHGIIYSFGVLFVALEEKFPTDKAKIALIPSILAGFVYLIGKNTLPPIIMIIAIFFVIVVKS